MNYPLTLRFKIVAFAPQIFVEDATGQPVCYVRQKMFKLKEHVEVFTNKDRNQRLADIRANKMLDWSARYTFTDAQGVEIGSVGRQGMRSLWRARYDVFNPGDNVADFTIHEENPGAKVMDSVLGGIPVLGMFTGYLFHPRYLAAKSDGSPAIRLTKQAAFWEGRFLIEKLGELTPREELNLILSFVMLNLLERRRG